jgi:hypothetical protein
MFQRLSKRERFVAGLALVAVVLGLVFHFLLVPAMERASRLDKEIVMMRARLARADLLMHQKDVLAKYLGAPGQGPSGINGVKDPVVGMLVELEGLAKEAGVSIVDIRPRSPGERPSSRELLVDMKTEGSVKAQVKFLLDLESSFSLMGVKKYQLTPRPDNGSLEGSFSITQPLSGV